MPINIIVGEIFCFSSNVISNKCHDALTVGAKGFFAGTWLFSVSWDGDFCFFFGRIVSCKSAICTSWSRSNFTSSIFLFYSPLMFSWRIFISSLAYFSQGAGDRTPLRGPFSPRRHPSSFVTLCEPGIVRFGGFCYGRLPPKASSRVDSNCGIHFWGLYFSCWDQFRLWFVAVLSRRHSPLVMGPCGRLCLIYFTSPGLVTTMTVSRPASTVSASHGTSSLSPQPFLTASVYFSCRESSGGGCNTRFPLGTRHNWVLWAVPDPLGANL